MCDEMKLCNLIILYNCIFNAKFIINWVKCDYDLIVHFANTVAAIPVEHRLIPSAIPSGIELMPMFQTRYVLPVLEAIPVIIRNIKWNIAPATKLEEKCWPGRGRSSFSPCSCITSLTDSFNSLSLTSDDLVFDWKLNHREELKMWQTIDLEMHFEALQLYPASLPATTN